MSSHANGNTVILSVVMQFYMFGSFVFVVLTVQLPRTVKTVYI